ncbi:hypothetical protein [Thermococcus sp. Bubb.Bath]|uniref:hypothetical protein n=1 Tax=Thermococcus sp. Bubb.Bath TaxID=1638242 RepID=UPI00197D59FD|nr:hypothetical protein [Thermococcus sp. Bubb.Bath]
MISQVRRVHRRVSWTLDSLSIPKFLLLNILLTGLLLLPPSKFTLLGYIGEIIKLGVAYGWFVFLMALLSLLVDVPNKLDVSTSDWISSIVAFGFITSVILWARQWPVILKVLVLVIVTYLWSHLTIRVLKSLQGKDR